MEVPGTVRPPTLTRLCVLSFINQGVVFPMYLGGFLASFYLRDTDPQALRDLATSFYQGLLQPEQLEQMYRYLDLMRDHGVALMGILTLRTAARFVGTLRMWRLKGDGFHIYTTAQLLGILLPMLVVGTELFNFLGLVIAALWCVMYYAQIRAIGALGSGLGRS